MLSTFKEFTNRLKFVKLRDVFQVFPASVAYVASWTIRWKHRHLWLVCERHNDARDNGYWFFKYLCEHHPEIEAVYAIDKNSPDRVKVSALGKVIDFGSFKHWLYYWMAERNVSSQKEGKPNAALCYIFEVYLGARKNRVYLKHGIIKDYQRWIFKDISKINLLICGAQREFDYIHQEFGYLENEMALTGLSRYDNLLTPHEVKRQILVMPTQREWLRVISSDTLKYEKSLVFTESEYFKTWSHLLASEELRGLLEKYQIDLLFYPHASMQQYVETFAKGCDRIIIGTAKDYDVQHLLMESAVLITDYSSIYFDFAYMEKPLIYYQFDYEKYRRGQYQQGYFSYESDGFGPVVQSEDELIEALKEVLERNCEVEATYLVRSRGFFAFHDTNNCERTYQAIRQMSIIQTNKNKNHECKITKLPPPVRSKEIPNWVHDGRVRDVSYRALECAA